MSVNTDELRRLANDADDGEQWWMEGHLSGGVVREFPAADAAYIAAANPATVLELLDELDRLRAEVERLRGELAKPRFIVRKRPPLDFSDEFTVPA